MFQDYILEKKLDKYEASTIIDDDDYQVALDESRKFLSKLGSDLFSKEKVIENYQDYHHHDVTSKQFFNEFPRKQTNNDLQYHNEDVTLKFIVDWFLNRK